MATSHPLPTVFELLYSCDRDKLAEELLKRYLDIKDSLDIVPTLDHSHQILNVFYEQIHKIIPHLDYNHVMVCETSCEQDLLETDSLTLTCQTYLYCVDDILKFLVEAKDQEELEEKIAMNRYGYEFDRWADILGYRVFIPKEFSECERVKCICDIIWEMTFFGIEQEESEQRVDETIESLEKSIEEAKNPDNLIPFDFEKYDKRTDYEREWDHRMTSIYMDLVKNLIPLNTGYIIEAAKIMDKENPRPPLKLV